jgi:hypothetical protein
MADIWRGSTALITGATRGIGAAFADQLARRGANLVLVARDRTALEKAAADSRALGVRVDVIPADLSDSAAPAAIERQVSQLGLAVDHLINNAGIGVHGRFWDNPPEDHGKTIAVNVSAPTALAALFLPPMLERKRGGILNVASTAAFQGLAWLPVYSATKAYVVTWTEALWVNLRGTGVRACCLCPGGVDTPFFESNQWHQKPPSFMLQNTPAVARAGIRGYEADISLKFSFLPFALAAWSTRLVPRWLAARAGSFYARPDKPRP